MAEGEGGALSSRALPKGWAPMAPRLRVGRTAVGATWSLCACFLDETPFVQLDFEQIAAEIHFRREIVERCIHETLLFFAGALRDDKEVEFSFKGIGILAVRRKVVSMTFVDDCLLELDGTGNMPAALLGVSLSFLRGSSLGRACHFCGAPPRGSVAMLSRLSPAAFCWLPSPASPPGLDTLSMS